MNFRREYDSNLPPKSNKDKPAQSQSPLHKKRFYKFIDSASRKAEQSVQHYRLAERFAKDPPKEKKEEFKVEIDKRYQRSAVNEQYRFPVQSASSISEPESLSDDSVESLERLAAAVKYDLNSQNLRRFAKLQYKKEAELLERSSDGKVRLQSSIRAIRNTVNRKSTNQDSSPLANELELVDGQGENGDRRLNQAILGDSVEKSESKRGNNMFYIDQSRMNSEETPTTNDTVFSTSIKNFVGSSNANTKNSFRKKSDLVTDLVERYSTYDNTFSQNNAYHSRPISELQRLKPNSQKQLTISTKELNIPLHKPGLSSVRGSSRALTSVSKTTTQTRFFAGKVPLKKPTTIEARHSPNAFSHEWRQDTNNSSLDRSLENYQKLESNRLAAPKRSRPKNTYDNLQPHKSRSSEQPAQKLQSTSKLYDKMQKDLIYKFKGPEMDYMQRKGVNVNIARVLKGAHTTKAGATPLNVFKSQMQSSKGLKGSKVPNISQANSPLALYLESKRSETQIPKLEVSATRPATIYLKQRGVKPSPYLNSGLTHLQKLKEKTDTNFMRNSKYREGKLDLTSTNFEFKNLSYKNGAKTERLQRHIDVNNI